MFESVLTPIAWTFTILVLLCIPGSSIPDLDGPVIPHFDKLVHFLLFAVFSGLWNIYLSCKKYSTERLKKGFWLVFLSAVFYGALLEVIQYYLVPDRSFDPGDIAADAAGGAAAYAYSYFKLLRINSGN
ncbi:VanZ family protein [Pseudoflavitalea rhizosphaerae]|uniref:VanZ family protein n=1 Tax=Pseudoflavitalea rhizosphaerae TaxID=1884793 RepID=UPI001F495291|nr:VanZ family protein [Pseudoflavitalea rhizosphaerae]